MESKRLFPIVSDFTIDTEASPEDLQILGDRLDVFNTQQTNIDDCQTVGLIVRNSQGSIIGGLSGVTNFGWLYIGVIWLDESMRGMGLGSQLLQLAETKAIERGCRYSCLSTFTFQAKPFYEKHGYEVFGQLDDYPEGETMYFMRKNLLDREVAKPN